MLSLSVLPSPARPQRKAINDGSDRAGKKGWSWLRACPRMVAPQKCLVVCRMYFEGCINTSLFLSYSSLSSFCLDLTILLSLSPDCIRIDCSLSKWFYSIFCLKIHVPTVSHIEAQVHDRQVFNIYVLNFQVPFPRKIERRFAIFYL